MTLQQIRERHREMRRCERANDILGAELIAIELAPILEEIYDELDNRGIVLSWMVDQ